MLPGFDMDYHYTYKFADNHVDSPCDDILKRHVLLHDILQQIFCNICFIIEERKTSL